VQVGDTRVAGAHDEDGNEVAVAETKSGRAG